MTAARLAANTALPNDWRLLRVRAPELARAARPGQGLELTIGDSPPLRLPVSHVSEAEGWLAMLAPPGQGVELPPNGAVDAALGGDGWDTSDLAAPALILGSGSGLGAALFLADRLAMAPALVLLGGPLPPPFRPMPSVFVTPEFPPHVIAAAPLLEGAGTPSRIACEQELPGCWEGSAWELLVAWRESHRNAPVFACAPAQELAQWLPLLGPEIRALPA